MDTERRIDHFRPFDRFALGAVCLALAAVFAYLTVFCLIHTATFDPENIFLERVVYVRDPVLLTLGLMGCLALLVRLLLRFEKALPLGWCTGVFLGLVFIVGVLWMNSLSAIPRADAQKCYSAGVQLALGRPLESPQYFQKYPFQAGYALYCELFVRLFGEYSTPKIGYANALLLALSYAALLALLWDSCHDKRLQLCAVALLALLIQPLFYVTFVYGFIPGLAFSLWGLVLAQRWVRQKRWWHLPLAAALCAVAVVLKPNYWIMAVAILLVLLLYCARPRHIRWLPLALLVVLVPMAALWGAQRCFESRAGLPLGEGTPQSAWFAMGLQEGSRASGWYNDYTALALDPVTLDSGAAHRQALEDIQARLKVFAADPAYALSFFHDKLVSQWSETTYEALWVNRTLTFTQPPSPAVESILSGEASQVLSRYMDGFTALLFLAFALGLPLWFFGGNARRRSWEEGFGLGVLAVAVFGGWLYHMLFEAKCQYLFIYLPMMTPFAAHALALRRKSGKGGPGPAEKSGGL
ncbi:MAG: hypothetical protein VB099_16610 [Candidatus Limiplasma sp.]|nr:hypothetical protein [Candidatus Limiplasma sp.]